MMRRLSVLLLPLCFGIFVVAQTGSVRVTVARANVRQSPSDKAPVVGQATYGQELELRGVEGDWFRVVLPMGGMRIEAFLSRKVATRIPAPAGEASTPGAAPGPLPPAVVTGASVAADIGGQTSWLGARLARVVPVAARATGPADLPSDALEAALAGNTHMPSDKGSDVTWTWVIDQLGPVLDGQRPTFFASYADVPGIHVDEVSPAIVRLVPGNKKFWVVATARGRADAAAREEADWTIAREMKQDAVKVMLDASAAGLMKVRMSGALPPGDYALVLRPIVLRKYSGREVLGGEGMGLLFGSAWPFTIKG